MSLLRRFIEPLPDETEEEYLRALDEEEEALSDDLWSQVPYDPDARNDDERIEKHLSNDIAPVIDFVPNPRKGDQ